MAASVDIALVRELIALQAAQRSLPLAERRRLYERAERAFGAGSDPVGVCGVGRRPAEAVGAGSRLPEAVDAGGCAAEWVVRQYGDTQPVVLYLHGGGYSIGSSRSHRHLSAAVGRAANAAVLSVDYRRAPEFAFPAAVEDAVAAVRWLCERCDAPIALAGDSAGGGLVVAAMLALRDAGCRLPAAGVCLSPWADLTCTAPAHELLAVRDPLLSSDELEQMAAWYLRGADPRHPLASPVFATLTGLPPLLIQAGSEEILLDDARMLARAARRDGVEVTLQEWPGMVHVWQWYFPLIADGRRAIASAGAFIEHHASRASGAYPREVGMSARAARMPARTVGMGACATRMPARTRAVPATPVQEAHLKIVPWTGGRGFLSWVYQLNGRLDADALAGAIDDVVRRHEILRVRFELRGGRLYQVPAPFTPGWLERVELSEGAKREGLDAAIAEVRARYGSLSAHEDPSLRATLYAIDAKTSVLAMFVAEALIDGDSGALLSGEITRAYAERCGMAPCAEPRAVSALSYLDHAAAHPPDRLSLARARAHWIRQAHQVGPPAGWSVALDERGGPSVASNGYAWPVASGEQPHAASCNFALSAGEWTRAAARARALSTTPYVLMLTCLQSALAHSSGVTRFAAHAIASNRDGLTRNAIGNFHSLVRIDMRYAPGALERAVSRTAAAVAQAVDHRALPAVLVDGPDRDATRSDPLAGIRFYMFASHGGPVFPGLRRRRFRLHGAPHAALSVSCVFGPQGRQDFILSSTAKPRDELERVARALRGAIHSAIGQSPRLDVSAGDVALSESADARVLGRCPMTVCLGEA